MSCGCETYSCIEAFVNPCSDGVEIPVLADFTGNITGRVWFNGVVRTFTVGVEEGENIIIPIDAVNENYTHELRLYKNGVLWACYTLKTHIDIDSPTFAPMPTIIRETYVSVFQMGNVSDINTVYGSPISISNGQTIQHNDLIGAELLEVQNVTEDLAPITGSGVDSFNSVTGTITLSNPYSDTFFVVTYKKQA